MKPGSIFIRGGRTGVRPALFGGALLAALSLLGGCLNPSFPKARVAESVQKMCKDEYGLEVRAAYVEKTVNVACTLNGFVDGDMQLQSKTVEKLEGAMMSATRVALSTDAEVDFLVIKAHDPDLGVTVTFLRYVPDIKGIIYRRIPRGDFDDRLVMEMESEENPKDPAEWEPLRLTDFIARLAASRLQKQFSSNPLVSVFLKISHVEGRYAAGTIHLTVNKIDDEVQLSDLSKDLLRSAAEKAVADALTDYEAHAAVRRVVLEDEGGHILFQFFPHETSEKKKDNAAA